MWEDRRVRVWLSPLKARTKGRICSPRVLAGHKRRLVLVAGSAIVIAGLFAAAARAQPPPSADVSFSLSTLFPNYNPNIHDYVVRCNNAPVTVTVHASTGWEVAINGDPFRSGDFSESVPLGSGVAFAVSVRDTARTQLYRYHVRCLPNGFPTYTFTHQGPVSPKFFSVDQDPSSYAIIFNNHGVPIWWDHTRAHDTRVLPNGKVLWVNAYLRRWEIHRLDGSLVRVLGAIGARSNNHDLQLLGNGDYLLGALFVQSHVDTSAYGGSSDADVMNIDLQEVGPGQSLVWDWKSQDHISLAETGRWWDDAINHPIGNAYDIVHWNSIDPVGSSVIASFRHLDAVYKIDRSTGNIVWKLGGTNTPQSLTVMNDPDGYTFGGQHDARQLPDGTLTVFDNRTQLTNAQPRAERFRIDEASGTATLLQTINDPAVPSSDCCGSARRLGNGDWLISWGGPANPIGGYTSDGQRTFLLSLPARSYRAEPVPAAISAQDLRQGMTAMFPAP